MNYSFSYELQYQSSLHDNALLGSIFFVYMYELQGYDEETGDIFFDKFEKTKFEELQTTCK